MNSLSHYLALIRIQQLGPAKCRQLEQHFDDLGDCFSLPLQSLIDSGVPKKIALQLKNPDWAAVERDLEWAKAPDQHILSWHDEQYPTLLKETVHSPPVLFIKGDIDCLQTQNLAMVGSRNPSIDGQNHAFSLAYALSEAGFTIVSGLALGIDGASHQGALKANSKTIAVVATGLDSVYPARHRGLAEKISHQGAIVSEFPLGTQPRACHFPQRNRIISGLSLGVIVVEAAIKSGSLITARYALEQGREIFAVPGSIHNPMAKGCHALIQQGAKLIEKVDDIIEELAPFIPCGPKKEEKSGFRLEKRSQKLVKFVGYGTTTVDQLSQRSGLAVSEVSAQLLELELQGLVRTVPGGYMRVYDER